MAQCPLIAQQALDLLQQAPWSCWLASSSWACAVCRQQGRPSNHDERRQSAARPLGRSPPDRRASALRQASNTRDSARITPLPLVPFHLGIGLTRRVELPLGVFPLPLYDAFEFTLGMKHVQAHRHCLGDGPSLALRASGCIRQLHPAFKPLASIGYDVFQARPVGDHVAQLSRRSGPRWPAIHAMLWGSIAIKTGSRCRKISSRQSTRTRA